MRLIYIYIHKYRNIEEQGFNLSSDYKIDFRFIKKKNQFYNIQLNIEKIQNVLPHLFNENIIDIKGIVGENGAGKSNLLEYLVTECHNKTFSFVEEEYRDILIYENEINDLKIISGHSWDLSKEEIIFDNYSGNFNLSQINTNISWGDIKDFSTTKFIYYSNIFDNKISNEYNGLVNISTNYLLKKDVEKRTNTKVQDSEILSHRILERRRQLNFILNFKDDVPFNLPTYVQIFINENIYKELDNVKKKLDEGTEFDENSYSFKINHWFRVISQEKKDSQKVNTKDEFLRNIQTAYFTYFITNDLLPSNGLSNYISNFDEISKLIFDYLINTLFQDINSFNLADFIKYVYSVEDDVEINLDGKKHTKDSMDLNNSLFSAKVVQFQYFMNELNKCFKSKIESIFSKNSCSIKMSGKLNAIIEKYDSTVQITDYLNFNFSEMSSGELGFLTLFSRFYSLISEKFQVDDKLNKSNTKIIILIDEGDLYFHPKWQTKFIFYINDLLPKIFKGNSIQIILTSHSQFIASDLPSSNLIFLKKDVKSGKCKVVEGLDKTFAANIHDLLSDTFFLEGAHIGEFAKNIIYKVIDQIENKENNNSFSNDEIKAIINIVGESWVQSQLFERFNNNKISLS